MCHICVNLTPNLGSIMFLKPAIKLIWLLFLCGTNENKRFSNHNRSNELMNSLENDYECGAKEMQRTSTFKRSQ